MNKYLLIINLRLKFQLYESESLNIGNYIQICFFYKGIFNAFKDTTTLIHLSFIVF